MHRWNLIIHKLAETLRINTLVINIQVGLQAPLAKPTFGNRYYSQGGHEAFREFEVANKAFMGRRWI